MRVGSHPMKYLRKKVGYNISEKISVGIVTYIPMTDGYWKDSLDVFKLCLASLRNNTPQKYDLVIFDNGSCKEVLEFIDNEINNGKIQMIIKSEKNLGPFGAMSHLIGSSQADYFAFADSDVLFLPNWLESEMQILDSYPNVGMVSGFPTRNKPEKNTSTINWALNNNKCKVEYGQFSEDKWLEHIAESLGKQFSKYLIKFRKYPQCQLTYNGCIAYSSSSHFQFLTTPKLFRNLLPLIDTETRQCLGPDTLVNKAGLLRLTTTNVCVYHIGNSLNGVLFNELLIKYEMESLANERRDSNSSGHGILKSIIKLSIVNRIIKKIYALSYELLYKL